MNLWLETPDNLQAWLSMIARAWAKAVQGTIRALQDSTDLVSMMWSPEQLVAIRFELVCYHRWSSPAPDQLSWRNTSLSRNKRCRGGTEEQRVGLSAQLSELTGPPTEGEINDYKLGMTCWY